MDWKKSPFRTVNRSARERVSHTNNRRFTTNFGFYVILIRFIRDTFKAIQCRENSVEEHTV